MRPFDKIRRRLMLTLRSAPRQRRQACGLVDGSSGLSQVLVVIKKGPASFDETL